MEGFSFVLSRFSSSSGVRTSGQSIHLKWDSLATQFSYPPFGCSTGIALHLLLQGWCGYTTRNTGYKRLNAMRDQLVDEKLDSFWDTWRWRGDSMDEGQKP